VVPDILQKSSKTVVCVCVMLLLLGDNPPEMTSIASRQLSERNELVEDANFTSKVSTVNTSNTAAATNTVTLPTCEVSRHFDVMSFIGGMVFIFGSVAILCFARLFFEVQQEHRYHTL